MNDKYGALWELFYGDDELADDILCYEEDANLRVAIQEWAETNGDSEVYEAYQNAFDHLDFDEIQKQAQMFVNDQVEPCNEKECTEEDCDQETDYDFDIARSVDSIREFLEGITSDTTFHEEPMFGHPIYAALEEEEDCGYEDNEPDPRMAEWKRKYSV